VLLAYKLEWLPNTNKSRVAQTKKKKAKKKNQQDNEIEQIEIEYNNNTKNIYLITNKKV
jgi:hypothetical protein